MIDLCVIGGGAAGIFAAINAKSASPQTQVIVLEKTAVLLSKVRISGGGRCNVTHNCFLPKELTQNYPRGDKELLGPFHSFQPQDTIAWFEARGAQLKTEPDGRIFPVSDSSETIIQCLLSEAKELGIDIRLRQRISGIIKEADRFIIEFSDGERLETKKLLLATGSSPDGHKWCEQLGHAIQKPVPSLFTFNVPTSPLKELSGIAHSPVELNLKNTPYVYRGPLLITHFGFSGPAALKLSAWGARYLHEKDYKADLSINWLPALRQHEIFAQLQKLKTNSPNKQLSTENIFNFPKNLWKAFVSEDKKLKDIPLKYLENLSHKLHDDIYRVEGKTTHKEEFVTCGGVTLKEVDFKTMQSKICPGLYFAGEILDIDGITGGFNFQNAWTTAYVAGNNLK